MTLSLRISSEVPVPEVGRSFGIVIRMFFDDHPPPHLHAEYGVAPLAGAAGRRPAAP